ncbi:MAG: polysaccharide deacetylase family protein [Candidatus Ruminococcus intestinipullorum]|nr:polysaccharide deacetylase family protein [Candidatus Ruminococcus intestinipullorum]
MLHLRKDILLFPDGKKKAFTFSFDDGVSQDIRFIELLRKYHIKSTFNLNSNSQNKKKELSKLYAGFEVAVHGKTHAHLRTIPTPMLTYEILENKKELETLTKHPIQGMAYPFGEFSPEIEQVATCCGIVYGRTAHSTHEFFLPENFMHWNPTCHYADTSLSALTKQFLSPLENSAYNHPLLLSIWGHTYEFDENGHWQYIEDFCQYIGDRKEIWYASNIEIYEYIQASKTLVYSTTGNYIYNPSRIDIWMMINEKEYCIKSGQTIHIDG